MNLISYLNKELSEKSEENLELISLISSIADSTIDIAKDIFHWVKRDFTFVEWNIF